MRFPLVGAMGVLLCILIIALYFVFVPENSQANLYQSPIPTSLTIKENNQISLLDFWLPYISGEKTSSKPEVTGHSVLMYELNSGKTLYEKNSRQKTPMASLTKIMTAIIAIENPRSDDSYKVTGSDLVGEDSMGLVAGEQLPLKDLLFGLMLPSGNDAAEVLAHNYKDGRGAFVKAMNDKAKALGLKDTHFSNPSGLQGDGEQYSTAYDLLVITKYALETFPLLKDIVSTYQHEIPATSTHQAYSLTNETNLLSTYPGVKGVKTGYTPEAGMCLVSYLEYDGHHIIGILLNSEDRRGEMRTLLDYSLTSLNVKPPTVK